MKIFRLFHKRTTCFLLLVGVCILGTSCSDNSKTRVAQAAQKLANLDSITDFSSNRNHPVPEIENIAPGLYGRLRGLKPFGVRKISHKLVEPREDVIERFGSGDLYEVTYDYQNGKKQRYFLFSGSENEPLRIIGY